MSGPKLERCKWNVLGVEPWQWPNTEYYWLARDAEYIAYGATPDEALHNLARTKKMNKEQSQ